MVIASNVFGSQFDGYIALTRKGMNPGARLIDADISRIGTALKRTVHLEGYNTAARSLCVNLTLGFANLDISTAGFRKNAASDETGDNTSSGRSKVCLTTDVADV